MNPRLTTTQRTFVRWFFEAFHADAHVPSTMLFKAWDFNAAGWPRCSASLPCTPRTVNALVKKGWLEMVPSKYPGASEAVRLTVAAVVKLRETRPSGGWPGSFNDQARAIEARGPSDPTLTNLSLWGSL